MRSEAKCYEAIFEVEGKSFYLVPNKGRFLCFCRHHGFDILAASCSSASEMKSAFFRLHSFPSVSAKTF